MIEQVRKWLDAGGDVDAPIEVDVAVEPGGFAGAGLYQMSLLMVASIQGHGHLIDLLLERGARVDWRQSGTRATALHFAVCMGHLPIVERLIRAGADTSLRDSQGRDAEHLAWLNGQAECTDAIKMGRLGKLGKLRVRAALGDDGFAV